MHKCQANRKHDNAYVKIRRLLYLLADRLTGWPCCFLVILRGLAVYVFPMCSFPFLGVSRYMFRDYFVSFVRVCFVWKSQGIVYRNSCCCSHSIWIYTVHQDVETPTPRRILCLGLLDDHVRLMFPRQGDIRRSIIIYHRGPCYMTGDGWRAVGPAWPAGLVAWMSIPLGVILHVKSRISGLKGETRPFQY